MEETLHRSSCWTLRNCLLRIERPLEYAWLTAQNKECSILILSQTPMSIHLSLRGRVCKNLLFIRRSSFLPASS